MADKTALVTGGGRGIGRAICTRFARGGYRVVAVARSEGELAETARCVEAEGGACRTMTVDVTDAAAMESAVQSVVSEWASIDVLVNNAGVAENAPLESFDIRRFDGMVATNVNAVFYACRAVWPIMRECGGGIIVNISSVAAVDPFPGFAAYGATKTFVNGLTKALSREGAEHGIRVYGVAPGAVDTKMLRGPFPDFPEDQCLKPADIAEVVWLMTEPVYQYSAGGIVYVRKS